MCLQTELSTSDCTSLSAMNCIRRLLFSSVLQFSVLLFIKNLELWRRRLRWLPFSFERSVHICVPYLTLQCIPSWADLIPEASASHTACNSIKRLSTFQIHWIGLRRIIATTVRNAVTTSLRDVMWKASRDDGGYGCCGHVFYNISIDAVGGRSSSLSSSLPAKATWPLAGSNLNLCSSRSLQLCRQCAGRPACKRRSLIK